MNEDVRDNVVQNSRALVPTVPSSIVLSEKKTVLKKRNVQKKSREKKRRSKKEQSKIPNAESSNFIPVILFTLLGLSALILSQYPKLSSSFTSPSEHPFLPSFQKALRMIESTDISWVSEISQSLLRTSNLLKDVSHFTQKFAPDEEVQSMKMLENDFYSLSNTCKDTYKLGFNIFAEARTFTKTCSRRLDLVLSVARDDRLNNAKELLTRMSETLNGLVEDHDLILDNLSELQQKAVKTSHKMLLDAKWNSNWSLSKQIAVYALVCLGSQAGLDDINLLDGFEREARESSRIVNELAPICDLLPKAVENLQQTRTNLHLFNLQLQKATDTLNTKSSLCRNELGNLELLIDNAKAFLERLGTKYEDLVSKRSAQI